MTQLGVAKEVVIVLYPAYFGDYVSAYRSNVMEDTNTFTTSSLEVVKVLVSSITVATVLLKHNHQSSSLLLAWHAISNESV